MVHCVHVSPNRICSVCYKDVTTCVGTAKITVCARCLPGNKRNRIETLTQCAEWSPFELEYLCGNLPL